MKWIFPFYYDISEEDTKKLDTYKDMMVNVDGNAVRSYICDECFPSYIVDYFNANVIKNIQADNE